MSQTWLVYGAFMSSEFYVTAEDNLELWLVKGSDGEVSAGIFLWWWW